MTEDKGFEVHDRRAFASQEPEKEEAVQKDADAAPGQAEEKQSASQESQAKKEYNTAGTGASQALPQVNFPTFIISLSSSVLVYLGEMEDPATGETVVNLPVAKQTIDILGMLEEKTKGNLSEDESRLLQNILYDLRMRYVALAKK
ncbi:protein of unknown function [Desulfatibacillum alkenivorans DSM 16219]|jgi:hypothetical protein|uniref:DUF1844 domain-containing protein n=1 Tax=Desulfatibacillum alkenivorans DSM 16219 TaxID=1121393 RepID=A0A1M6ULE2_9BACT|nr:DUF1844 domain-containing protein [Desulfatibacillum alkenivorans]SHK70044.1 protein of unknown function [Desulfatibacillum alkenivorans DSM 16219]